MVDEKRKIVIPGEVIAKGEEYLPGEWTEKQDRGIVALRYGLAEESNKLVKVIPLSGVYSARRGNVVIGKVENLNFNGWMLDIGVANSTFLSLAEVPRYVNKADLEEVFCIGDVIVAKIFNMHRKGIDLTVKGRGLGKIEDGLLIRINSNKVPRVIGKEGSMIKLIKDETGCDITVGQNGIIWIKGNNIEAELHAKKAINFVTERSFVEGLTEKLKEWFDEEKK